MAFQSTEAERRRDSRRDACGEQLARPHDGRSASIPARERVALHTTQTVLRRLRYQPPQRLPYAAAPEEASADGSIRWAGHQYHYLSATVEHDTAAGVVPDEQSIRSSAGRLICRARWDGI